MGFWVWTGAAGYPGLIPERLPPCTDLKARDVVISDSGLGFAVWTVTGWSEVLGKALMKQSNKSQKRSFDAERDGYGNGIGSGTLSCGSTLGVKEDRFSTSTSCYSVFQTGCTGDERRGISRAYLDCLCSRAAFVVFLAFSRFYLMRYHYKVCSGTLAITATGLIFEDMYEHSCKHLTFESCKCSV